MSVNLERDAQERKRRERLAASLRENLKRRNLQRRGRSALDSPSDASAPEAADVSVAGEGRAHGSH
jgi:uncharacterized protein YjiS (DUF1127 family)